MTLDFNAVRLSGLSDVDLRIGYASPSDLFILQGIDGMGPSDINVSISNTLNQGGVFQNKTNQLKQPVIRIGLNPDFSSGMTAADLRDILYGLLSNGTDDKVIMKLVKLNSSGTFVSEAARVEGWVSKFEEVPFSKDPQVQITLECIDPMWKAPAEVTATVSGTLPTITVTNQGKAAAGFYMKVTFNANLSSWQLTKGTKKMLWTYENGAGSLFSTWILEFSTVPGNRYARLDTGGGVIVNMLSDLSWDSDWLQLAPGVNSFTSSSSSITVNSFKYTPKYWGV